VKHFPGHCDLCGLPLRHGMIEHQAADTIRRFCCIGCRQVFLMLVQSADGGDPEHFKDSTLFRKCMEMGLIPQNEAALAGTWAASIAVSEPASIKNKDRLPPPSKNTLHLRLGIGGMWCPICAWAIEETLRKNPGIRNPVCLFSNDILSCDYDPVITSPAGIIETIGKLGYQAHPPESDTARREKKTEFIRLCVSAFLSMNIMMFSFSLYFGFFQPVNTAELQILSWPVAIMASVVFFHGGWRIHLRAISSFQTGIFGMETLIGIGAVSAYFYSIVNFLAGSLHLYFDTTAMLITLSLLGKWLEGRARDRIGKNLAALFSLQPAKVRICSPEAPDGRYVSAVFLKAGDTFRVEAGEIVPADGRISDGEGLIDESNITGEAIPRKKGRGDLLKSGTRVMEGGLRVTAERIGAEGTLGQMVTLIQETLSGKTPIEDLAQRYLRWFVPMIIGIAALTAGGCWYYFDASAELAVIRGITVLVVSCPCALGIAIPLARVAGISVAGAQGILVRSFSAFEKANDLHTVVFDKTGTVTDGHWTLNEIIANGPLDEASLLGIAAGLETKSDHSISVEIRRLAREKRVVSLPMESIDTYETGISGHAGGKKYAIGSFAFVKSRMNRGPGGAVSLDFAGFGDAVSRVYLGVENRIAAVFIFGDRIRPSAFSAIGAFQAMGIEVALVSGDDERVTESVAKKLGIDTFFGAQSPGQKVSVIKRWQQEGKRVAMVGDGINDAPALAQSDLSIAVYSGNQLCEETADISLMSGDLQRLLVFFSLAGKVRTKIKQNLILTFLYNLIAIPVAMAGLLSPLVAVSAMLLSSLSVIGNTLLLIHVASRESDSYAKQSWKR
jgi:heavy metal translocating P-type ATPase